MRKEDKMLKGSALGYASSDRHNLGLQRGTWVHIQASFNCTHNSIKVYGALRKSQTPYSWVFPIKQFSSFCRGLAAASLSPQTAHLPLTRLFSYLSSMTLWFPQNQTPWLIQLRNFSIQLNVCNSGDEGCAGQMSKYTDTIDSDINGARTEARRKHYENSKGNVTKSA